MLLYLERQSMFEQPRYFLPMVSMSITYTEEVTVSETQHVRVCKISILVHLVRVVRSDSTLSCEGKFCNDVVNT